MRKVPPRFLPSKCSLAFAVLLLVPVAAEAQPAARRQLTGRVVDGAGTAIAGAFVTVRPSEPSSELPELEALSDDAGRFLFEVPPGTYRVAGHVVGFDLSRSTVEVAADRDTAVSVVMAIGAIVDCDTPFPNPVRVRTRRGEPLPTAFLTVTGPGHRPLSLIVRSSGSPAQCSPLAAEDQVTLDALGYGEHLLKPAGVEPGKVAWHIVIEPSARARAGRTTRAAATGQIRGRVFDEYGASIPDASVSFQPLDPRSELKPFQAIDRKSVV